MTAVAYSAEENLSPTLLFGPVSYTTKLACIGQSSDLTSKADVTALLWVLLGVCGSRPQVYSKACEARDHGMFTIIAHS